MPQTLRRPLTRRVAGLVAGAAVLGAVAVATAAPAAAAGALSIAPNSGLSATATASVSGTGFTPLANLYLAQCDIAASPGTACNQASYVVVSTNASGAFGPTNLSVAKTFVGWNGQTGTNGATVNCLGSTGHQCALQTSNVANGAADVSTGNITFA
jgi:hypothetical protein